MNVVAVAVPAFSPGTPEHALATWVRREGGFVGKVRVETRDGLRGLFVTEPVRAGELLVSVPPGCIVSADEDPQWGLSLRELLTARLVGARTRGQCQPYLDSLPTLDGAPLLCDWSDEASEMAQHRSEITRDRIEIAPRSLRDRSRSRKPRDQSEGPRL
uniref:Uncharacterized protein n=1 Tax=Emiliania huxleyi TaxID=2903 RepID=A0A7S3TAA6_EMIHU